MEKYRIEFTRKSNLDMIEIHTYLTKSILAPETARSIYLTIKQEVKKLGDFPERHELIRDNDLIDMGLRKLPVQNYFVFYHVEKEKKLVVIDRVIYARREWNSILREERL